MIGKKKLVDNELVKEVMAIRVDTLWKMLIQMDHGYFPAPNEEGATGKLDNKGAIFIPGGLVYQDVDEMPIGYDAGAVRGPEAFRAAIRAGMQFDNAILLFSEGIATGVNLDGGFFSKAAKRTVTFKKAAFRRKPKIGSPGHLKVTSDDILRSHCPTYMNPPYGSRTRISTCVSMGLINPPLFFSYCESQFNLSGEQSAAFAQRIDEAQDPFPADGGQALYPPFVVVCHDTRYKENNLTGLTRFLGIGKFGEFATLTFEALNKALTGELKRKRQVFSDEDVFATYRDVRVLGILRIYAPTNPGRRSQRYALSVVSPRKDLDLDLEDIEKDARERYQLRPVP